MVKSIQSGQKQSDLVWPVPNQSNLVQTIQVQSGQFGPVQFLLSAPPPPRPVFYCNLSSQHVSLLLPHLLFVCGHSTEFNQFLSKWGWEGICWGKNSLSAVVPLNKMTPFSSSQQLLHIRMASWVPPSVMEHWGPILCGSCRHTTGSVSSLVQQLHHAQEAAPAAACLAILSSYILSSPLLRCSLSLGNFSFMNYAVDEKFMNVCLIQRHKNLFFCQIFFQKVLLLDFHTQVHDPLRVFICSQILNQDFLLFILSFFTYGYRIVLPPIAKMTMFSLNCF